MKYLIFLILYISFGAIAEPSLTAQSWLIADHNGNILEGTHTNDVRSIASITKLMTSMVVLDSGQSLFETIPKKLYNRTFTRQELLNLAIVKSDNNAAKMLCEYYPGGTLKCIEAMNYKANQLNMFRSNFTDPTGLFKTNVSTAEDLIKLVMAAKDYPTIVNASNTSTIQWQINKKKSAIFHNTNTLVGNGIDFIVSKTGWITDSGGCIVMMLKGDQGIRTVILLGSKNTKTRIPEAYMVSKLH
jgi:serine-type D-Ala-D-Ala endopeptidase (penicillin-binding protein 7)